MPTQAPENTLIAMKTHGRAAELTLTTAPTSAPHTAPAESPAPEPTQRSRTAGRHLLQGVAPAPAPLGPPRFTQAYAPAPVPSSSPKNATLAASKRAAASGSNGTVQILCKPIPAAQDTQQADSGGGGGLSADAITGLTVSAAAVFVGLFTWGLTHFLTK